MDISNRTLPGDAIVLLDGGTGSELKRRGMRLDAAAWSGLASVTHYDLLHAIHADYIAAGADVITTNTFGTSRFVLEAAGHGGELAVINRRAVAAAREARDASGRDVAIAGSMSCLPPSFDVGAYPSEARERAAYRELAELLAEHGVDLLALEMLEDVRHAPLACEAAAATGLPFWLGLSCNVGADGALAAFDFPQTPLTEVLDTLLPFAPHAITVMHSPPEAIVPALGAIRARWGGTLGAYPEIGDGTPAILQRMTPAHLATLAADWVAACARRFRPAAESASSCSARRSRAARPGASRSRDTSA